MGGQENIMKSEKRRRRTVEGNSGEHINVDLSSELVPWDQNSEVFEQS